MVDRSLIDPIILKVSVPKRMPAVHGDVWTNDFEAPVFLGIRNWPRLKEELLDSGRVSSCAVGQRFDRIRAVPNGFGGNSGGIWCLNARFRVNWRNRCRGGNISRELWKSSRRFFLLRILRFEDRGQHWGVAKW